MRIIYKDLMKLLGLSVMFLTQAADAGQIRSKADMKNAPATNSKIKAACFLGISPNVICPGTPLNRPNLVLALGQDESFPEDSPPYNIPSLDGFRIIFGWDDAKIAAFRTAAIDWFNERFGIDFSDGILDPDTGIVTNSIGILYPFYFRGNFRVLASSHPLLIPPYSLLTPSTVNQALYAVLFFSTPIYGGTYANGGVLVGNETDDLAYAATRITLNYTGTKNFDFFLRNHYPGTIQPGTPRDINSAIVGMHADQIYSAEFGPGFATTRTGTFPIPGNSSTEGFQEKVSAIWAFPTFILSLEDWNEFTVPPVTP